MVQRLAGRPDHFQRALDPRCVGRVQPFGSDRVLALQRVICFQCFHFPDVLPDLRIDGRNRGDPVEQDSDIEAGAADQYRQ